MKIDDNVGERIQKARVNLGWSQAMLAELCDIAAQQLHRYEHGLSKPRPITLSKIAKVLNVSDDWLSEGKQPIEQHNDMEEIYRSQFRLPQSLYEKLKESADTSNRSVNAELIERLETSFSPSSSSESNSALLEKLSNLERQNDKLQNMLDEVMMHIIDTFKFNKDEMMRNALKVSGSDMTLDEYKEQLIRGQKETADRVKADEDKSSKK